MKPRERPIELPGLRLSAREWGEPGGEPVLALHGWLDNAASFDVLAPLLPDLHIVALDLPGHGRSEHRPPPGHYHLWDDLPDVLAVADALGWERFSLLGHSRGAATSTLLAVAAPERVQRLLLLDGIWPPPVSLEDTPRQLRRFLADCRRSPAALRGYATLEEAAASRRRRTELSEEAALRLAGRGTVERDGRFYWSSDSRLFNASPLKLTRDHARMLAREIACPTLVLLADRGFGADPENRRDLAALGQVEWELREAGHHCHMEPEHAMQIAARITAFIAAERARG